MQILTEWLTDELAGRGWTMSELARRAGISRPLVSGVLSGTPPTWDFCAAIAPALGVSPIEVFLRAGKVTPTDVRRALSALDHATPSQELIALITALSDEEREAMLRFLRGVQQAPPIDGSG